MFGFIWALWHCDDLDLCSKSCNATLSYSVLGDNKFTSIQNLIFIHSVGVKTGGAILPDMPASNLPYS